MPSFWKDFPETAADLQRVKELLRQTFDRAPVEIRSDLEPLFEYGGKGLRPAFILLAARSGHLHDGLYQLAAAAELLHLATLIHDDVVDSAELRRGQPAFPNRVGVPRAVLYGDLLFSTCFSLVTEQVSRDSALALSRIVSLMAGAEILQHHDIFRPDPSRRRALKKIMGKTASLISLCFYTGAIESRQPAEHCQIYRRLGYNVGMAFQIIDDILDFTATENRLGKPVLWDLSHGVFSLPVVLALDHERHHGPDRPLTTALESLRLQPEALPTAVALITQNHGLERARQLAAQYTERARQLLALLPPDRHRQTLATVIDRLLDREY